MLKEIDHQNGGVIIKFVNKSGKAGRSGEICEKEFRSCPELHKAGNIYLPTIKSLSKIN